MTVRSRLARLAALLLLAGSAAGAHEGKDHAEEPATTTTAAQTSGRMMAQGGGVELVAAAQGHDLTIWLDRWADGTPVTNARISVTVDGRAIEARAIDGTYILDAPSLDTPGAHRLSFAVDRAGAIQTLAGTLDVAAPLAEVGSSGVPWRTIVLALLSLGIVAGAVLLWRSRQRGSAIGLLLAVLLIPAAPPLLAHEGEDHAEEEAAATAGGARSAAANGAAARFADGVIVALKPLQRIIELRTQVAAAGQATPTLALTGRIIADPQGGGVVQSTTGGRVLAPGGLPLIGQRVRAGQVLATIEPPIDAVGRTEIAVQLADLDQQIALAANRAARVRRLEGVVPRREIEEAQIALSGLRNRRAGLGQARLVRETLAAPISGIVAAVPVRVGQVVTAETILFEIVDPARLFVEANIFDRRSISAGSQAFGRAADGTSFGLVFAGAGLADRGSAGQGQFRVVDAPPGLRVGEPVTIEVSAGAPVAGVVVPRASVLTGDNGLASVFIKQGPERFVSRPVRTAPLDATRVVILSGVRVGERVVTTGASLLSQVR